MKALWAIPVALALAAPANANWQALDMEGECGVATTFEGKALTDLIFHVRAPRETPIAVMMIVANDGWSAKLGDATNSKFDLVMGEEVIENAPYAYIDKGVAFYLNWADFQWMKAQSALGLYIVKDGKAISGLDLSDFYIPYGRLDSCISAHRKADNEARRRAKLESDYPADPFAEQN